MTENATEWAIGKIEKIFDDALYTRYRRLRWGGASATGVSMIFGHAEADRFERRFRHERREMNETLQRIEISQHDRDSGASESEEQ